MHITIDNDSWIHRFNILRYYIYITNIHYMIYTHFVLQTARAPAGGMWHHALNRGNDRKAVVHRDEEDG